MPNGNNNIVRKNSSVRAGGLGLYSRELYSLGLFYLLIIVVISPPGMKSQIPGEWNSRRHKRNPPSRVFGDDKMPNDNNNIVRKNS